MQFPKPIGDRETLALVMHLMSSVRLHEEDAVILQIGTHAPDYDCPEGFMSATVRVGQDTATSHAVHLQDALQLARGKCLRMAAARKVEAEKRKAEAA